jgi:DNA polymerase-3 subunit delta'
MILPWHESRFRQLIARRGDMPHAILIQGRKGIGKSEFAWELARSLLCEAPDASGHACGSCPACLWFDAGNHPDFRHVTLATADSLDEGNDEGAEKDKEKDATQITVDQIRNLGPFMTTTTHRQGYRVILVEPADALNTHAANALLKSLEEPPPGTVWLLVTGQPQRLPATVRSRCNAITLPLPDDANARDWLRTQGVEAPELPLALAGGAPLAALEWTADAAEGRQSFLQQLARKDATLTQLSAPFQKEIPIVALVEWLQRWCLDLIEMKLLGQVRFNLDFASAQQRLAERLDILDLLAWERLLREARRSVTHPLNPRLFAESLLAPYMALR